MSGECCKCGEHCLECICKPNSRRQENGWISVKDRLPKENEWIIGANPKRVDFGVWMGEKKGFALPHYYYMSLQITHWMPLPDPPKE